MPEGWLDYELQTIIDAKIAVSGYDAAREFIADCMNRNNDRLNAGRRFNKFLSEDDQMVPL